MHQQFYLLFCGTTMLHSHRKHHCTHSEAIYKMKKGERERAYKRTKKKKEHENSTTVDQQQFHTAEFSIVEIKSIWKKKC